MSSVAEMHLSIEATVWESALPARSPQARGRRTVQVSWKVGRLHYSLGPASAGPRYVP